MRKVLAACGMRGREQQVRLSLGFNPLCFGCRMTPCVSRLILDESAL